MKNKPVISQKWLWIATSFLVAICISFSIWAYQMDTNENFPNFMKQMDPNGRIQNVIAFIGILSFMLLLAGSFEFAPQFILGGVCTSIVISLIFFGLVGLLIIPMAVFGFLKSK